jgi:hypothetical protein
VPLRGRKIRREGKLQADFDQQLRDASGRLSIADGLLRPLTQRAVASGKPDAS